jgi:hypothetical protein
MFDAIFWRGLYQLCKKRLLRMLKLPNLFETGKNIVHIHSTVFELISSLFLNLEPLNF